MKVWVGGKEQELVTIGFLAKCLKRSVETIRAWERTQVIPKPLYRAKNGVRLYHPKEVEAMKKVLRKQGRYAQQQKLKKAMWEALVEVRKELLSGKEEKI